MRPTGLVLTSVLFSWLCLSLTAEAAPPEASDGRASAAREAEAVQPIDQTRSRPQLTRGLRDKGVLRARGIFDTDAAAVDAETADATGDAVGGVAGGQCVQPAGNCQANDQTVGHTSDGVDYLVAENFRPMSSGSITNLCWHGGYFDFTAGPDGSECPSLVQISQNRFRVRYFSDNGGVPGALIAEFRQANGTLVVGNVQTLQQIAGRVGEWEFVGQHAAVNVQAGQCYWIEISNNTAERCSQPDPPVGCSTTCSWLWEGGVSASKWLMQDNVTGYDVGDALPENAQFCMNVPLQDAAACQPPPPANDNCANAQTIVGRGDFPFTNLTATTDGPAHNACQAFGADQIEADVWFKWTSPCTELVVVSTCDLTDVDTRIAVYDGTTCPVTDGQLISCNDDRCGELLDPRQTLVAFDAVEGQTYLVRLGVFPGARRGADNFRILCGPPENASCPGDGSCCENNGSPGCDDATCCNLVCYCDPLCCDPVNGLWDDYCSTTGYLESGCGAQLLCQDTCNVCGSSTVDCCVGVPSQTGVAGCDDPTCCETVCAADAFCCEVEWDQDCATNGFNGNGNGAAVLCPQLCGGGDCPNGAVAFIDPPSGAVDARQPHPPTDTATRQGIKSVNVAGPAGLDNPACWSLCESAIDGTPNGISGIVDNGDGTFTINLAKAISTGAMTVIEYTAGDATVTRGEFTSHPANVNGDSASGPSDILALIDTLNGVSPAVWGIYSTDADHSGVAGPPDILRVIDLLNGASAFDPWLNVQKPACGACCPQ